jgi:DNA-binding response OmpR family regulator
MTGSRRIRHVFAADNDRTVLEMLKVRLDLAGFNTHNARSGQDLMALMRTAQPTLMIVDQTLSDGPGLEFLAVITRNAPAPCPILLTGKTIAPADIQRGIGLGVQDCLLKPYSGATVLDRAARLLSQQEARLAPAPANSAVAGPKYVFVADSDRAVLEMLQTRLNLAGFKGGSSRAGDGLLQLMQTHRPVLMIVDQTLADGGGLDLLEKIDKMGGAPCPILLTGKTIAPEDARRGMTLGVRDCLIKPFSGAVVVDRVKRLLQPAPTAAPAPTPQTTVPAEADEDVLMI